jgi:prepilin-type N-terminal cleavage/methylation domain-containing protein
VANRVGRDQGFTLTELIVVIAMIGFVAVAIGASFSVIVRTSPANEDRADDSRSLLNLTRWLPGDVASTYSFSYLSVPSRANGFTADGSAPMCTTPGALPGGSESLLNLQWGESANTYFVDYWWVRTGRVVGGVEQGQIERFSCFGSGSIPTSSTETLRMSTEMSELPSPAPDPVPVVVTPVYPGYLNDPAVSPPTIVGGVQFTVQVYENGQVRDILSLEARSKNIQGPPLGTTTGGGPGMEPNAEAPLASDLVVEMRPDSTETFDLPVYDYDGTLDRLVIEPDITSLPTGWDVVVPANSPDPQVTVLVPLDADTELDADGTEYVIPFLVSDRNKEAGYLTDNGTITVRVINDTNVQLAPPLEVLPPPPPPPCTAAIEFIEPNPVNLRKPPGNNPNNEIGALDDAVEITISRSGSCAPLVVTFQPDQNVATQYVATFNNSLTVTIQRNTYNWRIGPHAITLSAPSTLQTFNTVTLTVEPPT